MPLGPYASFIVTSYALVAAVGLRVVAEEFPPGSGRYEPAVTLNEVRARPDAVTMATAQAEVASKTSIRRQKGEPAAAVERDQVVDVRSQLVALVDDDAALFPIQAPEDLFDVGLGL